MNRNKWLIWILAVCLLFGFCTALAENAAKTGTYQGDGYTLTYELNEREKEVSASIIDSSPTAEITIPSEVDGYRVKKVAG